MAKYHEIKAPEIPSYAEGSFWILTEGGIHADRRGVKLFRDMLTLHLFGEDGPGINRSIAAPADGYFHLDTDLPIILQPGDVIGGLEEGYVYRYPFYGVKDEKRTARKRRVLLHRSVYRPLGKVAKAALFKQGGTTRRYVFALIALFYFGCIAGLASKMAPGLSWSLLYQIPLVLLLLLCGVLFVGYVVWGYKKGPIEVWFNRTSKKLWGESHECPSES